MNKPVIEKKIEKIDLTFSVIRQSIDLSPMYQDIAESMIEVVTKINEIIDYLNTKQKEK